MIENCKTDNYTAQAPKNQSQTEEQLNLQDSVLDSIEKSLSDIEARLCDVLVSLENTDCDRETPEPCLAPLPTRLQNNNYRLRHAYECISSLLERIEL